MYSWLICLFLLQYFSTLLFSILCLTTHLIHQGHKKRKEIRDVSTFTAQHVRAALSVLHMAQKIVSLQKHNMLSLLHAACLKLLVFYFFIWLSRSHFILHNTFSKFLYSSISVQLAVFLLVTSLLIFIQLLLQFFLCIFVLPLSSMTISFLPLYLQDAFSFPLLSHSHLFSSFLSQFYLYSTALYIIFLSPAIFHIKVTQMTFHTVQEVARRSCSPSTDEQSGGVHKEAVHTAAKTCVWSPVSPSNCSQMLRWLLL